MAEKVREGIRQAEKGLQNENQQLLSQEGILRQLPIVSNLLSWWSPSTSPTIKGLSFDLKSGALESTEPVHRYHMQIQNTSTIDQHDLQQQANMHREQSDSMAHQSENETSSSPSSIPITNEKNSQ
ncbi:unnamed protein product [Didymodactylos carnosus]|uniref:Uncharacterized protein n=1 Tax=Didymodactylos carnosus TaxID=1234261 RepID=A0A8S2TZY5_9BILA|nr:unnamed protein product [Didymodactylos carnosus]CAF4316279.1 unnamed protein product [Didymodactylos carnosus]